MSIMSTNEQKLKLERTRAIDVLIVGAGIGGLFAAIELHRNGHHVRVIESNDSLDPVGE